MYVYGIYKSIYIYIYLLVMYVYGIYKSIYLESFHKCACLFWHFWGSFIGVMRPTNTGSFMCC